MDDLWKRTVFSVVMALTFIFILCKGLVLLVPCVIALTVVMYFEIMRIRRRATLDARSPFSFLLQVYFLLVTEVLAVVNLLGDVLTASVSVPPSMLRHFPFTAFSLYVAGFVAFVMTLRRGMYRYQIGQFSWMVMTLMFVVVQGSLQLSNLTHGVAWMVLPVSCVIINDTAAYGHGKLYGRRPLLQLSPKKTWEGFIGGFVFTMIWGFWFSGLLAHFPKLTCPPTDLWTPASCTPPPAFQFAETALPRWIAVATGGLWTTVRVCPFQWQSLPIAAFASLVAPFGGFFASGLKRAFKLKDFGDLIPGHGGLTDRMDCQVIMGFFTYMYLGLVLREKSCALSHISQCVAHLTPTQRQELLDLLLRS